MSKVIDQNRTAATAKVLVESPLVILCGGHGTRLREETEWKPKPMVAVGNWPMLWHIMNYYACFGVRRFVLCLGYKGQVIREFFMSYHERCSDMQIQLGKNLVTYPGDGYTGDDWEITLVDTGWETQTAGRVKKVGKYLDTEHFLLTYGDGLSDVNINELVSLHLRNKRIATVTAVRPTSRFAELVVHDEQVMRFSEKPPITEGWVSGGFFVFNRKLLDYIDKDEPLEVAPLNKLALDGQLSAYQHTGYWQCVDTFRELMMVEKLWQEDRAPWKLW